MEAAPPRRQAQRTLASRDPGYDRGVLRRLAPLALCAALITPGDARATGEGLRYVVRSDAPLTRLDVEVCFEGPPPPALVPGVEAAGRALVEARDASGRSLDISRGRIELAGIAPGSCIDYRVDLDVALGASRLSDRFGGAVFLSAGAWLFRPAQLPPSGATLRFALPEGLRAAAPWPLACGWHRLGASAFTRPSFLALGRFATTTLTRRGVELTAVRLGDGWAIDDAGVERWLARTIDGVGDVQGRFPVERVLIVLVPAPGAGVHFGMVRRGGGPSVAFLASTASTADDLTRSWVPWHELSHLHLPQMRQRDAWLYEGLATYYQEVLRARAGVQSPAEAWAELTDGFTRGARRRGTGAALATEAAEMGRTGAYQRVYWAGTAFALHADVALRMRRSSLDRALAEGARVWRGSDRVWTSEEITALWDRRLERAVLRPLSERWAARVEFPSTAPLLRRLGVHDDGLRGAELSAVRDGIMALPPRAPRD